MQDSSPHALQSFAVFDEIKVSTAFARAFKGLIDHVILFRLRKICFKKGARKLSLNRVFALVKGKRWYDMYMPFMNGRGFVFGLEYKSYRSHGEPKM
jgi:hypothetical protein